jgi:hypothetical protein
MPGQCGFGAVIIIVENGKNAALSIFTSQLKDLPLLDNEKYSINRP